MTGFSRSARKTPLLPTGTGAFVRRRLSELLGLGLAAAALWLALALVTFDPADPSLNSATSRPATNLAGPAGAYAADLVLQTVGVAAAVVVLIPLAWAWHFMTTHVLRRPWFKAAMVPLAVLATAALAALVPPPSGWPASARLGGALGSVLAEGLLSAARLAGLGVAVLGLVCSALALIFLASALGLSRRQWRGIGNSIAWPGRQGLRAAAVLLRSRARDADTPGPKRIEPRLGFDAGPRSTPEADAERQAGQAVVEPRIGGLPPGRRATQPRQATLDLEPTEEYQLPPLALLVPVPEADESGRIDEEALAKNAQLLESVFEDFGVLGQIVRVRPGPVVTLYELEPAPGIKSSRVIGLADDIARSMSAVSVRVAAIPGRNVIGIELPNARRETVYLRELFASEAYESTAAELTLAVGKDIGGAPVSVDLARMPHLLVAGTTGSGKSVAINSMILSLLYRLPPDKCRLIMIDPKMLELSVYDGIPHLLVPVVTEPAKAVVALKWTVREMENRYHAMSKLGVRNIAGYNKRIAEARAKGERLVRMVQTGFDPDTGEPVFEEEVLPGDPMPFIVVIVDEMADLMLLASKEIEAVIQRLAQMARAAGIHLIMATQRPSVDVITGTIKANFPTRI
ncbi:MAG: DNA translocase FtsK 4TM domain-containing protein, partial [Alphaproteobacteria bacterium]